MTAILSPDGLYRYRLERDLGSLAGGRGAVAWIMLNPSTADATADDPTIRRCVGFASTWGFARLIVGNLYAWRSTKPKGLWTAADPVGPDNDHHLEQIARDAELVVCAWGAHGKSHRVAAARHAIERAGRQPHALAFTAAGQPRHPLYLRGSLKPQPWSPT